jgi:hypothetical protein
MDEKEIKLEARLTAIEHLLTNLYRITYQLAGFSSETIEAAHEQALKGLQVETFQGLDPALSDLWAAEIHDAISRLLSEISSMHREAQR